MWANLRVAWRHPTSETRAAMTNLFYEVNSSFCCSYQQAGVQHFCWA